MRWGIVFVLIAAGAAAQEPQFTTRAREVIVPVSVTTKNGKPVEDLTAQDFAVLSDGKPQTVRMVSRDAVTLPIDAVIVVQANVDSEPALAKIRKTASVVSSYITNDLEIGKPSLAALVTVGSDITVAQDFTADPYVLRDAFNKITGSGDSARLIDGVSLACNLLASRKEAGRRVVVLIGGTRDMGSKARFSNVILKAQQHDIVICTVSYSVFTTAFTQKGSEFEENDHEGMNLLAIPIAMRILAKQNIAEAFAQATGGAHDKFTTLRGLETQLISLGTEIHNRYTLTFVPPEPQPSGYHQLSVTVRNSKDWRIHARAGYWSGQE